jgi:hypothetical protein
LLSKHESRDKLTEQMTHLNSYLFSPNLIPIIDNNTKYEQSSYLFYPSSRCQKKVTELLHNERKL